MNLEVSSGWPPLKAQRSRDWFHELSNRVTVGFASVKSPHGMGLAVSPDEKRLLYTLYDRADSDLFLVMCGSDARTSD